MSRQSRAGQGEVCGTDAIFVGRHLLFLDDLVVGIPQCQRQLFICHSLMLIAVEHVILNGRGMNGLPWTIDSPIGIDHRFARLPTSVVDIVIPQVMVHFRTGLIVIGRGKEIRMSVVRLEEALAFRICGQVTDSLVIHARSFADAHLGVGDGLSCRGLHHHNADPLIRLRFRHHKHVGHIIQATGHLGSRLCGELQHIHADGQALDRQ